MLLDQLAKAVVAAWLPLGSRLTLLPGALNLRQAHNLRGSYIADKFNLPFLTPVWLAALCLAFILLAIAVYRYDRDTSSGGYWTDLAFLGFVAGIGGALGDAALRGYTIDFLDLPGLFVADLKDLYLSLGIICLMTGLLVRPDIRWWGGARESAQALARFLRYWRQEAARFFKHS